MITMYTFKSGPQSAQFDVETPYTLLGFSDAAQELGFKAPWLTLDKLHGAISMIIAHGESFDACTIFSTDGSGGTITMGTIRKALEHWTAYDRAVESHEMAGR